MRSNPIGRIIRNLLEAERKEAAYKEWVENLIEPPYTPAPHDPIPHVGVVGKENTRESEEFADSKEPESCTENSTVTTFEKERPDSRGLRPRASRPGPERIRMR